MENNDFDKKKEQIVNAICDVLIEKNKRYGNSALQPLNIFYKGDAINSIAIRLDDKISRIKNSSELRKNDMFDILGYLILYSISCGLFKVNELKNADWEDKVNHIRHIITDSNMFDNYGKQNTIFVKDYSAIIEIDRIISMIETNRVVANRDIIEGLIVLFVKYFIENDITDFKDLID